MEMNLRWLLAPIACTSHGGRGFIPLSESPLRVRAAGLGGNSSRPNVEVVPRR
jgi:hypothetical protein